MDEDSISDHKLCGFLCTVLSFTPSLPDPSATLGFRERCEIFGDTSVGAFGFRSEYGVVLVPADSLTQTDEVPADSEQCEVVERDYAEVSPPRSRKKGAGRRRNGVVAGCGGSLRKRRMTKIGMVNGSVSVVNQIHALVSRKCLKIDAQVVSVEIGASGGARAVVLVDVYLPVALWSGWQFPKSGSTAGALFRHLRFVSMIKS